MYCHATCATDTSNISFVMSVFDVILKENLRKTCRPGQDPRRGDGHRPVERQAG